MAARDPRARLFARAWDQAPWIAGAAGLALVVAGGRYVRAYLVKPILDEVLPGTADLSWILGVAAVLVVVIPAAEFGRATSAELALGRLRIALERDLCAKLLALPLRFHRDRRRGELLSRALRDVDVAHGALRVLFGPMALSAVMAAVGAATLLWISWPLALLLAVATPGLWWLLARFARRIRRRARHRQESFGEVTRRLVEIVDGIQTIQAFGAERAEQAAFRRATGRLLDRSMKVVVQRALARSSVEAFNNAAMLGVLVLGAWLLLSGRFALTAGDLAAFATVLATTYRPIKTLARGVVQLADAEPAAARLFEVLDQPEGAERAGGGRALERAPQRVAFHQVAFRYPGGRDDVLRDVSFELRPGEVVALVGRSGAGKTTVGDLLLRFDDPSHGAVEVDGVDLRELSLDAWRARLAVVTQEPFLFDGTIADNIRYGRPDAGAEAIAAAAARAHVDEFARELPAGLDTEVGAGGAKLSGGQRQRIAVARALLRDPDLLLFDEATNALDPESERAVQQALDALVPGRMLLVIAHRPATVRRADRVLVLDAGRIVQAGTPAELAARPGRYRELFGDDGPGLRVVSSA